MLNEMSNGWFRRHTFAKMYLLLIQKIVGCAALILIDFQNDFTEIIIKKKEVQKFDLVLDVFCGCCFE